MVDSNSLHYRLPRCGTCILRTVFGENQVVFLVKIHKIIVKEVITEYNPNDLFLRCYSAERPGKLTMEILYRDESIIVVMKPPGISSQETASFRPDMVSFIKKELGNVYVSCVHRLDLPVEGVMVYALTPQAAASLSKQFEQGSTHKIYRCICEGKLTSELHLIDSLLFDKKSNTSSVASGDIKGAKRAELIMRPLYTGALEDMQEAAPYFASHISALTAGGFGGGDHTLAEVELFTGRHHQIRVQAAHAGHPLTGDVRYNSHYKDYRGRSALCLMSYSLEFTHPVSGEWMCFSVS